MMPWYLRQEAKEKIRGIIKRAGGTIDEMNVIHGCDIYSSMFTEMLELGALVSYCNATGHLMISNWSEEEVGSDNN